MQINILKLQEEVQRKNHIRIIDMIDVTYSIIIGQSLTFKVISKVFIRLIIIVIFIRNKVVIRNVKNYIKRVDNNTATVNNRSKIW